MKKEWWQKINNDAKKKFKSKKKESKFECQMAHKDLTQFMEGE